MNKKKRSTKKRLDSLLLILVLSTVLMVMSTYAWFTANKTVNIDAIDVKVTTSNGLQISADGIDWKSVLRLEDLKNARTTYNTVTNQLPVEMAPVSTAGTVNKRGQLDMFYGNVYADLKSPPSSATYGEYVLDTVHTPDSTEGSGALTDSNADNGYYAAFDVFLKSGSESSDLYASGSVKEMTYDAGADKYTPIDSTDDESGIANAARVAFVKGNVTDGHTISTDTADIQKLTTAGGVCTIWEPNYDWHTANGVANAAALGWDDSLIAGASCAAVPYDGIKAAISSSNAMLLKDATAAKNVTYFDNVTPGMQSAKSGTPNMEFPDTTKDGGAALSAGVTKYRIYLWIEGQDVDCENFAAGSYVEYNLAFSLDSFK